MSEPIFTVKKLNEYVSNLLAKDIFLRNITVQGELSGVKKHSSGHLYFTLKDSSAAVQCVMFRQQAETLSFLPNDGIQVFVRGRASLYTRDGKFQLYAEEMRVQGKGALFQKFEQLKAELLQLGYFDEKYKKTIPYLPKCIGIITSSVGAALQDMLSIIRRRFPIMDIKVYPAKVQGEGSAEEIVRGIEFLDQQENVDVIIVGRGGGSIEDLWAFNERIVADAIFKCETPVISAVGHETDFTIADFVADLRAPTPSAAAELCVPEYDVLRETMKAMQDRLYRRITNLMQSKKDQVLILQNSHVFWKIKQEWSKANQYIAELEDALQRSIDNSIRIRREKVAYLTKCIESANPAHILQRGYVWAQDAQGNMIVSASSLRAGDSLKLRFAEGSAWVKVESAEVE